MRKVSFNNTNDGQRNGRQTVYQRGGQREGSPHYVLLYSDGENSGDEESVPLRTVSQSPPRRVEVIKIQLQPDDTLQALSLRYGSTVSELKRINNIHKDNEIFAHRTIKVPVKPFSLLTESLNQTDDLEQRGAQVGDLVTIDDPPITSREEQIINLITTPIVPLSPRPELNTMLNLLSESPTIQKVDSSETLEEGEENVQLLPSEESKPERRVTDTFRCSGADWGLSWPQLVGCSLLLGFAGPLIILYITGYSSKHHSNVGH